MQVSLLQHILGFGTVANDAPRNPVKTAVVGLHDGPNSALFTARGTAYQVGFIGPVVALGM